MNLLQFDFVGLDLLQHGQMMYQFPKEDYFSLSLVNNKFILLDFYNLDQHLEIEILNM